MKAGLQARGSKVNETYPGVTCAELRLLTQCIFPTQAHKPLVFRKRGGGITASFGNQGRAVLSLKLSSVVVGEVLHWLKSVPKNGNQPFLRHGDVGAGLWLQGGRSYPQGILCTPNPISLAMAALLKPTQPPTLRCTYMCIHSLTHTHCTIHTQCICTHTHTGTLHHTYHPTPPSASLHLSIFPLLRPPPPQESLARPPDNVPVGRQPLHGDFFVSLLLYLKHYFIICL